MKVLRKFRDKYNKDIIYQVGDEFISDDVERINDLISRGLIEGEIQPSFRSITKKEIMKLLDGKGIEYDAKAKKDELIELLQGGD